MARKGPRGVPGPSRLSQILLHLNKAPRPHLAGLKNLKLTLAARNDHFGARCVDLACYPIFLVLIIHNILDIS